MTPSQCDPQPPPVAPPPVVLRNGNGFDNLFLQKGEDDVDCIPRNNLLLSVERLIRLMHSIVFLLHSNLFLLQAFHQPHSLQSKHHQLTFLAWGDIQLGLTSRKYLQAIFRLWF